MSYGQSTGTCICIFVGPHYDFMHGERREEQAENSKPTPQEDRLFNVED